MASIYEQIRAAIQPDGTLPRDFSIQPPPEEGGLRFAEGAQDGIIFYHVGRNGDPELLARLEEVTRLAAEGGDYETLEPKLAACFGAHDRLLGSVDDFQEWIIDRREELDPNRLFAFANEVLLHSASLEAVKYALTVLELLLPSVRGEWQDTVRTLALSDELTLYCVFVVKYWEDRDEELFAIAQKVRGWGRVHAVWLLEPASQEMKTWLLDEGWRNEVLASYSALDCAEKGGLLQRLEQETLSREQLDAADGLIRALLDEGPKRNISVMYEAEDLLLAWLDQLERAERNEEDQRTLRCLREESGDRDWPRVWARLAGMEV